VYTWATTTPDGIDAKSKLMVGFINEKLKYFKVQAISIGDISDPSDTKEQYYLMWEEFLAIYRNSAPD
jgi:hypothetical protein